MVIRMRHTRSHTKRRRSHHALEKPALTKDASGNLRLRHRLSPTTGEYRGRKVLDTAVRIEKKLAKKQKKEETR